MSRSLGCGELYIPSSWKADPEDTRPLTLAAPGVVEFHATSALHRGTRYSHITITRFVTTYVMCTLGCYCLADLIHQPRGLPHNIDANSG